MTTPAPFPDAFASAAGAMSMRDVLSRRCAEQAVEIALLRKECARLRKALERSLNWLASYPGEGTLGPDGPYKQARDALAERP